MRQLLFFLTLSVFIMSCGQNDTKQKEPEQLKEKELPLKEKDPPSNVNDTVVSSSNTPETIAGEKEISVIPISNDRKSVPDFKGPAIYLHLKKELDGSFFFIAKANEWGVMNINGKIVKLTFVKGYEDEATYSNADYEMYYSLDYRKAPEIENPTIPCTIIIKGKGYKKYQRRIWGEWGDK